MTTMTMTQHIAFNTLDFANRLKAAGVAEKIAETQAQLQSELQQDTNKKFDEQQAMLNELTKHELATKDDINRLETKIDVVENKLESKISMLENKLDSKISILDSKISMIENKLVVKLGGIMVGCSALLGSLVTFFHQAH